MRIQWRYQPCPCLLAGGLALIWETVSPVINLLGYINHHLMHSSISCMFNISGKFFLCVDQHVGPTFIYNEEILTNLWSMINQQLSYEICSSISINTVIDSHAICDAVCS